MLNRTPDLGHHDDGRAGMRVSADPGNRSAARSPFSHRRYRLGSDMSSFLGELFSTIAERGLTFLEPGRQKNVEREPGKILDQCAELLSSRGEASGIAEAARILACYNALDPNGRAAFLEGLRARFGADLDSVAAAVAMFAEDPSQENAGRLHESSEPRRQELIRRLNRVPGGVASLVAMRTDLLRLLPDHPELALVDRDFRHLLRSWFNRGFLVLRRIDWRTPANILEKIIAYEAVHEINGWDDLRQRVESRDRRLYAFFHPSLAEEPLVFVEVALTDAIPDAIGPILSRDREPLDPEKATVAAFYAISNCQDGLRGISFGNFLIKQVVDDLRAEWPGLKTFVTLSPVPGFRKYLDETGTGQPAESDTAYAVAEYLVNARRPSGEPRDPVARFHLGNGASLEAIHLDADLSEKGMAQSFGVMVNYRYDPQRIEQNHEAYANKQEVIASSAVRRLLRSQTRAKSKETA